MTEEKDTGRLRSRLRAIPKSKRFIPLKRGMYLMIAVCWIVPLLTVLAISSSMTETSTRTRVEDTIRSSAFHCGSILEEHFAEAMEDSRAVSYDGIIWDAYSQFLEDRDRVALYDKSFTYLNNKYVHSNLFEAVYFIYPGDVDMSIYVFNRENRDRATAGRIFEQTALDRVMEASETLGTRIAFLPLGGEMYMVRNVVNSRFETYAVLVMQCDQDYLFEIAENLVWVKSATVVLDGRAIPVVGEAITEKKPGLLYDQASGDYFLGQTLEIENHEAMLMGVISGDVLAQERASTNDTMALMVVVSGLLLILLVHFVYRNIYRPVDKLVEGMERLEQGNLGYHVEEQPANQEFKYLTTRFNDLSDQLKEQFERNNMEQIALHEARIKALQSQINPHFLNNTLELINWEARMADDKKVCQMIDALSVMLNAAMARGGKATVNMREEMSYIDAYLYIISQRFGQRLKVVREIQEEVWEAEVPRLILQPIVENAIEHGISLVSQGVMHIKLYLEGDRLIMDVEHNGQVTPKDREAIDRLLNWDGKEQMAIGSARIGIRNVNQRLKILYGPDSGLTIEEYEPGQVRSRISLPFITSQR